MKQHDLEMMYKRFRHYFSENMPEDMTIKITRARKYIATQLYYPDTGEQVIFFGSPGIKPYLGTNNITWESILLHEMCHVWQQINLPNDTEMHSPGFMNKLKDVEKKSGIPQYWDFMMFEGQRYIKL